MAKLQSINGTTGKETLYVDVDDEITTIIDKVASAKSKVVALVLPKRCSVLQSVVNMKLLKRTADKEGKNLVLVTTENGLMPLAGAVGLYVASTPSSKPVIPNAPVAPDDDAEDIDEPLNVVDGNEPDSDFDAKSASGKPIGELAAAGAIAKDADDDIDESIDMGDAGSQTPTADATAKPTKKAPKPKKDKTLRVPNFDSFRKKLMLGALALVLLIALWIVAFKILPRATVTIGTDSKTIPTNATLSLDTAANKLDTTNGVVPATAQSQQKTSTQTVPATGQQNNGQKASGQVTFTLQDCNTSTVSVPAGSGVSSGGQTFITQGDMTLNSVTVGHQCNPSAFQNIYSATVTVVALKGGANYNVPSGSAFTLQSGTPGASDVSGSGSTSGGTDNIVTVVQQSDITSATSKIKSSDSDSVKQEMETNLESKGLQPVAATFLAGTPQITMNEQVGSPASSVTVTAVTNYTMLGVKKSDLQTLVDNNVTGQLDKGKQVILDDGVANAQFTEDNPGSATSATVAMSVASQVGPQLNIGDLKKQLVGMKSGDVENYVKQTPGVTSVQVHYSPFWVSVVPSNASKVKISIVKAQG